MTVMRPIKANFGNSSMLWIDHIRTGEKVLITKYPSKILLLKESTKEARKEISSWKRPKICWKSLGKEAETSIDMTLVIASLKGSIWEIRVAILVMILVIVLMTASISLVLCLSIEAILSVDLHTSLELLKMIAIRTGDTDPKQPVAWWMISQPRKEGTTICLFKWSRQLEKMFTTIKILTRSQLSSISTKWLIYPSLSTLSNIITIKWGLLKFIPHLFKRKKEYQLLGLPGNWTRIIKILSRSENCPMSSALTVRVKWVASLAPLASLRWWPWCLLLNMLIKLTLNTPRKLPNFTSSPPLVTPMVKRWLILASINKPLRSNSISMIQSTECKRTRTPSKIPNHRFQAISQRSIKVMVLYLSHLTALRSCLLT